jgi:hypothetical protein
MSFIVSAASNYILNDGLGDWSSLVTTPTNFTGTACLYYSTCLMANISRVLGRSDDADKYDTLAGKRSSSHTQIFSLISFFFCQFYLTRGSCRARSIQRGLPGNEHWPLLERCVQPVHAIHGTLAWPRSV